MFLLLYAIFLIFFWFRAVFWLTPERYPNAQPAAIFNFRKYLLSLYGRYAGLLIFSYFLALANGLLAGYFQRHHEVNLMSWSLRIITVITVVFDLCVLIYITINLFKNIKFFRQIKNSKKS